MKNSNKTEKLKVKTLALEMLRKTEGGINRIDIGIGHTLGMIGTGKDLIKF
ncbi:hypothetical protein [Zobellia barbeyronii]|uniref:Uncharacterized protein n=1 Tax=Zobellia barbeyronii TaxID=2748009 RepID=A0ABS5WAU4_9FLAO|nr:hypothetical protein [Zobellia barbeyronii]MBT2160509.1 hypothetical protein [Zobellia barbeyronii]